MSAVMRIDVAEANELERIAPLFAAYRVFYEQESDPQAELAFLHQRMSRNECIVFVARQDDVDVGFTLVYFTFDSVDLAPVHVLHDLFVAPQARRQGVARALMSAAHDFSREQGACRMDLATAVSNTVAQPLYESLGYERDDEFYHYSKSL